MFNNKKPTLQDKIRAKTDRQLMEDIAYFSNENEKHLRHISKVASYFFYVSIIGFFLYLALSSKN
jgi:hypothetical protein